MLRASLRSRLARKIRLLLSGLAVALGVALMSGTFVLTDTLGKVFDDLFAGVSERTSVTVRGASALEGGAAPPVEADLLDRVQGIEGVAEAAGVVTGYAELMVGGEPVRTGGVPSLRVAVPPGSSLETPTVLSGEAPSGPAEIALHGATAERVRIEVDNEVQVALAEGVRDVTVTGTVGLGDTDGSAGASLTAFDLDTAQEVLGLPGTYQEIAAAAARTGAALPDGVEAVTVEQRSAETSAEIKHRLGCFTTALLVFAGISLFVGAFLIFNTFSMLVLSQPRSWHCCEPWTRAAARSPAPSCCRRLWVWWRACGPRPRRRRRVRAAGPAEHRLARGRSRARPADLPRLVAVGIGVTAVAAVVPARRAARVGPVEAMPDSGPAEERFLRRRGMVGAVLLVSGVAALGVGLAKVKLPLVGAGAAVTYLGIATVSPLVARPVASVLGAPFARLAVSGRLGRANAVRSPRGTSATAAALMLGLALVSAVSLLRASLKESVSAVVDRSVGADYVVMSSSFKGSAPEVADRLRAAPGLDSVLAVGRAAHRRAHGRRDRARPSGGLEMLRLEVVQGDLGALDDGPLRRGHRGGGRARPVRRGPRRGCWGRTGPSELVLGGRLRKERLPEQAGGVRPGLRRQHRRRAARGRGRQTADGVPPQDARAAVDAAVAWPRSRRGPGRVRRGPALAGGPAAECGDRADRAERRGRGARHREHAGAVGRRADPRARATSRRRAPAPPAAAHDPRQEGRDRALRRAAGSARGNRLWLGPRAGAAGPRYPEFALAVGRLLLVVVAAALAGVLVAASAELQGWTCRAST